MADISRPHNTRGRSICKMEERRCRGPETVIGEGWRINDARPCHFWSAPHRRHARRAQESSHFRRAVFTPLQRPMAEAASSNP
jgi:hypothetical protein